MLNGSRNLYRVLWGQRLVAFITAASPEAAIKVWRDKSDKQSCCTEVKAERLSFGYPLDICEIY